MITFHSVIDSPLSVKRVMPPTTTMAKTRPPITKRYRETRGEVRGTSGGSGKVEEDEPDEVESMAAVVRARADRATFCRSAASGEAAKDVVRGCR